MSTRTYEIAAPHEHTLENPIVTYYDEVRGAIELLDPFDDRDAGFEPGFELPELTDSVCAFYAASRLRTVAIGRYGDVALRMLDLTGNPRTRTTKTNPSLLMVARAVRYIQRTGERIMILTPTSANKGTALRDAVLRAIEHRLVEPAQLQIATVAPAGSRDKLWASALVDDPELRRRNPLFLYGGAVPADVKLIAQRYAATHGRTLRDHHGVNLWYTLDLRNYMIADTLRAFFEADHMPPEHGAVRFHAHAVSSAYGLLGYHLGRRVLAGASPDATHPSFLLVQQLRTPDMVCSLRFGTHSSDAMPSYSYNPESGLLEQTADPAFPYRALALDETIDATFYTRNPPTSALIDPIVARHGGGGIVVSLHECLERYAAIRARLAGAGVDLPSDPRRLREWALVMVLTGVCNAIDRGIVPAGADVVVHASGNYADGSFEPVRAEQAVPVRECDDMVEAMTAAVR
jgi:hypothetical protein